ncbi:RtcB family protein [Gordonia rubripertincta]|uniref:3'-phosphate/5'-hydroxy nucleic acid ligase n=1 Tax=Gordonia rubripertincta TaxID=36822 RepID=A0AAW4G623_GORRU|nr:RtcB family protein [Gordonia rubripertincta]MBM7278536.1 RtcB family protein [Gordonia rubripertincta]
MPEMIAPKVLSFASILDDTTRTQAHEISSLPFIHPHVALMPDAHAGKGSAVGTVIPTVDAVIPAAVGVDIGCGMIGVQTSLRTSDITGFDLADLRARIEKAIPLSPGNYNKTVLHSHTEARIVELEHAAAEKGVDLAHSPKWREQLGSLGGGNHFIELCEQVGDEQSGDEGTGSIWLFLHSGSRGVGNKIAQKHIKVAQKLCRRWHIQLAHPDLAYLASGTPEFGDYIRELRWAQRFAFENRAEMMDRFVTVFGEWLGDNALRLADPVEVRRINCHHNYTEKVEIAGRQVWLTRKGAIDAGVGTYGLIPGSMGTKSYVVRGLGSESGLFSAPHGAGRRFSRSKAKKLFTLDDLAEAMTGIEYRHGTEWIDEIPAAYKPIDQIMDDARDLVEVEAVLTQLLNVKGV